MKATVSRRQMLPRVPATTAALSTSTRQRHLGMNTPPIVSPEDWEAALQQMLAEEKEQMLAEEKAQMRAGDALAAERRRMPRMAVENHPRNFPSDSCALSRFS